MPDSLSTLALATGGAFLGKFIGPAAEHYGKLALERAQQLGTKATALLGTVGREPKPVEPKLLVPLIQAASLETDETLAEKWAALLANAADPLSEKDITLVYVDILRQLNSQEVGILNMLFAAAIPPATLNPTPDDLYHSSSLDDKSWATGQMLNPSLLYTMRLREQGKEAYTLQERIELDRLDTMVDNFLRQQILILAKGKPLKDRPSSSDSEPEKHSVFFTSLGYEFMKAVTPPTP